MPSPHGILRVVSVLIALWAGPVDGPRDDARAPADQGVACTVTGRSGDELVPLLSVVSSSVAEGPTGGAAAEGPAGQEPDANPGTSGPPVTAETVADLDETLAMFHACMAEGALDRALALIDDTSVAQVIVVAAERAGIAPTELVDAIAAGPVDVDLGGLIPAGTVVEAAYLDERTIEGRVGEAERMAAGTPVAGETGIPVRFRASGDGWRIIL